MDLNGPMLLAIAAVITSIGTAIVVPVVTLRKARIDREPNSTEKQVADAASSEFLLTLVKYSKDEVTRWKDAYDASSAENVDLRSKLSANLALAEETERRMALAIDYLVALADRKRSVTAGEIVRWANIALDRSIPRDQFEELMRDADGVDDTVIPTI
ncbi:hypothetical protein QE428_002587 [Microbacterium sp. SORGH_AS 505]|uniref:hypothetical protein n=1 Tax=Microbacterium sp. SORGH_AS_0505 TaxID=3041770 RepID=UPI00277E33AE|nr:hypothetical protein [Microbacterium sp. SORGH_AS_0505]MDQ1127554.1 hypothetical protein [Microbacterium sp. SORGH_AS_0505]